jgi:ribosomal protein L9
MSKSFNELTKDWSDLRKKKAEEHAIELNVELDAAADYYERTGRSMHTLGSVEQRKIIEAWKEDHDNQPT